MLNIPPRKEGPKEKPHECNFFGEAYGEFVWDKRREPDCDADFAEIKRRAEAIRKEKDTHHFLGCPYCSAMAGASDKEIRKHVSSKHPGKHIHIEEDVRWIRIYMRGSEEECPEKIRLSREIMQLLVKRETSLAEALDALTTVMLNALVATYGEIYEFFRLSELVSRFPGSTERDRAVGLIPRKQPGGLAAKVQPRTVTMVQERPERVRRLAIEVGEVITKRGPSLGDGLDALSSTMLTAIEATCGRKRADEFDLLMAGFSICSERLCFEPSLGDSEAEKASW